MLINNIPDEGVIGGIFTAGLRHVSSFGQSSLWAVPRAARVGLRLADQPGCFRRSVRVGIHQRRRSGGRTAAPLACGCRGAESGLWIIPNQIMYKKLLLLLILPMVAWFGWESNKLFDTHTMSESLFYGLALAGIMGILWSQILKGIYKTEKLNAEQCRHLAVTLRSIGIGALIPVGLKIYGTVIPSWIVIIWGSIAIWLEILAMRILGKIRDETEE